MVILPQVFWGLLREALMSVAYKIRDGYWVVRKARSGDSVSRYQVMASGLIVFTFLVFVRGSSSSVARSAQVQAVSQPRAPEPQVEQRVERPAPEPAPAPAPRVVIDGKSERRALRTARPDIFVQVEAALKAPELKDIVTWSGSGKCPTPTVDGAILRSMRWQDLVWAVEDRYDLPRNLLMVILIQESMGALFLNCGDDGGAGLLHKQFNTAEGYGLKTLGNRGRAEIVSALDHPSIDRVGGKALRYLFEVTCRGSLECAARKDDRFHLLLDIDSAARKLVLDMGMITGKKARCRPVDGLGPLYRSLCRYSGRPWLTGKRSYFVHLKRWKDLIEDPVYIQGLKERFNAANRRATVNGQPATYDRYVAAFAAQGANLGLDRYRQFPRYSYPEAAAVKSAWEQF